MKILSFAFTGLAIGFILAVLADQSVWLEMRVDTGLLLPAMTVLACAWGAVSRLRISVVAFLCLEAALVLLLIVAYGPTPGALCIMPAAILRDGFLAYNLSLPAANSILIGLLILGNGLFLSRLKKAG